MRFKQIWQAGLSKLLLLWIIISIIVRPGWLIFGSGCLIWLVLVFLTAPGVFWYYAALFSFKPSLVDRNLEKAVAKKPLIFHPYLTLGLSYARRKKWPQAVALLEQAVEYAPGRKKIQNRLWLSEAYRADGANQKAIAIMEDLLKQGLNSMRLYVNLALAHLAQNSLPQALEYAQKARALDVSATEPVLVQAKIYFNMGEFQLAKDNYQWVVERLQWPVESLYWLGRSELELKEVDAAIAHLQAAVARIAEDPLLSDVSKDEAEEWLNRALAVQKSNQQASKH